VNWYPSGGGKGEGKGAGSSPTETTAVTTAGDDDPTIAQQPRLHRSVGDDDPTIARQPALRHSLTRRPTQPDEPTVNDDDPTVNRKALSKTEPAAELLDHRYQLLGQIGAGGMGEVWRARHVKLARDVAIKFLTNEEGGRRFELEAQAIAAINHTGVVDVLDFGETAQGVPYFVMELIQGETLSARVRRQGPLSWALVRNIALEVSDALAYTHAAGVIHRDLKPSNVIVLETPPPRGSSTKLIDFGIAKVLDTGKPKITKTGYIQGTPAYMSPEQVLAEPVDARSDVYGLGCLLYFLLSGRRPFPDKSGTAALRAQLYEQPPRFAEAVPGQGVPLDAEAVVFRAMAKDKTARFASMRELHAAILAIPPDAGASAPMPAPPHRLRPSASHPALGDPDASGDALRTTAAYSTSYAALNAADTSASASGAAAASSSAQPAPTASISSSNPSLTSSASALGPTAHVATVATASESTAGDKIKLALAVTVSVLLLAAAVIGLVWALTS
jgi:serine/threonine protein kinase